LIKSKSFYTLEILDAASHQKAQKNKSNSHNLSIYPGGSLLEAQNHLKIISKVIEMFRDNSEINITIHCQTEDIKTFLTDYLSRRAQTQLSISLDRDINYNNIDIALCTIRQPRIKFILYGIPVIPFYIPTFYTKIYMKFTYHANLQLKKLIIPNLTMGENLLDSRFVGEINYNELHDCINTHLKNGHKKAEQIRNKFAANFLGIEMQTTFYRTFEKYRDNLDNTLKSAIKTLGLFHIVDLAKILVNSNDPIITKSMTEYIKKNKQLRKSILHFTPEYTSFKQDFKTAETLYTILGHNKFTEIKNSLSKQSTANRRSNEKITHIQNELLLVRYVWSKLCSEIQECVIIPPMDIEKNDANELVCQIDENYFSIENLTTH